MEFTDAQNTGETIQMREAMSSFELNKNSKGFTWKIKVYDNDLDKLREKVAEMNKWAEMTYA